MVNNRFPDKYKRVKNKAIPLWTLDGTQNFPSSLYGLPLKLIDQTSTTYTLKFNEEFIFQMKKDDCY